MNFSGEVIFIVGGTGSTPFSTAVNDVTFTVSADTTAPTGTITAPTGPVVPGEVFSATVVFSEPIIGFDESDLNVTNGTVSDFSVVSGGDTADEQQFTFNVTAGVVGVTTIDVAAGAGQDAAGNDNLALVQSSTIVGGELSIAASFLGDPPDPGDTTTLRFTIQNSDDTETGDITFFTSDIDANLTSLVISGTSEQTRSARAGRVFLFRNAAP